MPVRKIEQELDGLNALRSAPDGETAKLALCKALRDRVNLLAAKAAEITAELGLTELLPDLENAFERFFEKPVQTDPQCWAKNAISKALKDLGYADSPLFLRGLYHVQLEPVYGGQADSAETLRGTCALALVECRDIPRQEIMQHLVNALTENAAIVRAEAARALEAMDGPDAPLLLRLKARVGDKEPGVSGQVFDSLLALEAERGIPFVAEFLDLHDEDVQEQAALSLGVSRLPDAVNVLKDAYSKYRNSRFAEPLLRAISASRQEPGFAFLLQLIRTGRENESQDAIHALAIHKDSPEIAKRVQEAIRTRRRPQV
jgi:HEAT repeat protein